MGAPLDDHIIASGAADAADAADLTDDTERRDAAFGTLLTLRDGLEQQYWDQPDTQRHIVFVDFWGMITGMAISAVLAKFIWQDTRRSSISSAKFFPLTLLGLQLLQFSWLCIPSLRPSYLRWRMRLTLVQRTIRITQVAIGHFMAHTESFKHWELSKSTGSWRPFLGILFIVPAVNLIHTLNHRLPTRYQTRFSLAMLVIELGLGIPNAAMLFVTYGPVEQAQAVCKQLHYTVGLLASLLPPDTEQAPDICRQHAVHFVVAFTHILCGVVLPMHLIYWQELRRKARYVEACMRRQRQPGSGSAKPLPAVRPARVILHAALSLAAVWWLSNLYAPHADAVMMAWRSALNI